MSKCEPESDDELVNEVDKVFDDFFGGATSEKQFHARLRKYGWSQDDIDEMRDMWLVDRLRKQKSPLFARATAILMSLPLEDRRELRDILRQCMAALPSYVSDLVVQIVFIESAGGILSDGGTTPPHRAVVAADEMKQREKDAAAKKQKAAEVVGDGADDTLH